MNPMAYLNDGTFDEEYKKYHINDTSLVCRNNILYYYGETKPLHGMFTIQSDERVDLGSFRLTNLNQNQWQLEPYKLYFYVRESVRINDTDIKNSVMDIYNLINKMNYSEADIITLDYIFDYYNSLQIIENNLSDKLYDSYNYLKNIFSTLMATDPNRLTPNGTYLLGKFLDRINTGENSSSQDRGTQRVLTSSTKAKYGPPVPVTPLYQENTENQKIENVAFISVVLLIVLMLAIVLGTLTYIFA